MSDEKTAARILHLQEYRGAYVWDCAEIEDYVSFKCRDDDVWVCSYPRSGTTLTQQMVYLIMTLDFDKAMTVELDDRFPIADCCDDTFPFYRGLKYLDDLPTTEPRLVKSHIHHYLLPDELKNRKGRIIYITRNPKASVVSLYKVLDYLKQSQAPTLREYVERFLTQKDVYSCPWGLHVREFWEKRNESNILFLQFEKVVKDRRGTIKRIAEFLGRDLTDDQIDKIMDYTSLESMKKNTTTNMMYYEDKHMTDSTAGAFINKGEVGGWRNDLPEDLIEKMDELIKNELKDTDIVYE